MADELWVVDLGTLAHRDAYAAQEAVRARRLAGEVPDVLLFVEHPPTYTRGRRSAPGDLPLGDEAYRARGIAVEDVDRGGSVTWHGPGQLVGYPIMRADDVVGHVRAMEDAIVAALAEEGIDARGRHAEDRSLTGVWVGEKKIASIGVHVHHGVTTHGFSVNVANDLAPFTDVVACAMPGVQPTSVGAEGGTSDLRCFRKRVAYAFAQAHGRRQRLVSPARAGARSDVPAVVASVS